MSTETAGIPAHAGEPAPAVTAVDPLVTALGQVLGVIAELDDDEVRRVFASVAALRDMSLCTCGEEG